MRSVSPSTGGDLEIGKLLGEGGMGAVYAAKHALYGSVVVKEMHAHLDQRNRDRFRLEAEALAKVSSPNVVRVVDWGDRDGHPFLVMERLDGVPLQARMEKVVRTGTRLSPIEAVDIAIDVLRGLSAVHRQKMVHRDVKPDNIFLVRGERPFIKVLDFGIAKQANVSAATGVTRSGTLVGTPLYMAPEQLIDGEPADAQADLWALSAVAYEALTGRAPFPGKTVASVGAALAQRDLEPASTLRGALPGALDAWFERAFAREVANRFADAEELAGTFADATQHAQSQTPGRSPPRAVIGIALAATAATVWFLVQPTERPSPQPVPPSPVLAATPSDASATAPRPSAEALPVAHSAPVAPAAPAPLPRRKPTVPVAPQPSVAPQEAPSPPSPALPAPGKKGGLITDAPF